GPEHRIAGDATIDPARGISLKERVRDRRYQKRRTAEGLKKQGRAFATRQIFHRYAADEMVGQLGGRHCIQPGADCLRDNAPDAVWSYPPIENPSACFGIDDRLSQQLVQLQNLDPALLHFEGEVV